MKDAGLMLWKPGLWRNGFIFESRGFECRDGVFFFDAPRPSLCRHCGTGLIHSHGFYQRTQFTLYQWEIVAVQLGIHRWFCVRCKRTMSTPPPNLVPRHRACTLVMVMMLWCYLAGKAGFENCARPPVAELMDGRRVARYLAAARTAAVDTQQYIREVVLETIEPGLMEDLFPTGLPPPESLLRRQSVHAQAVKVLYGAFVMLVKGSAELAVSPSILLARARNRALQRQRRFLF